MKYIQFTVNINQSNNCSIIQYLGVLALLLAFVSPTTYQQSPRDYYQFLNHGYKFGQTSKELSKLKVDVLGKVLKKHVTQLRSGRCPVSRSSVHTQTYSGSPSEAVCVSIVNDNKLRTQVLFCSEC